MKSSWIIMGLCLAGLPLHNAFSAEPGGYTLVKQNAAISLYERWISHKSGEPVRELKAVLTVQATIDAITTLLANSQQVSKWNARAKTYQVLPLAQQQGWIAYIRYSIPWPFDDQDCCLQYTITQRRANTFGEVQFQSIGHPQFPVKQNITRLTGIRGSWLLQGQPNNRTQITYTITTDRSVKVPRWITDPVIRNNLFDTMTAFKNLLEKK